MIYVAILTAPTTDFTEIALTNNFSIGTVKQYAATLGVSSRFNRTAEILEFMENGTGRVAPKYVRDWSYLLAHSLPLQQWLFDQNKYPNLQQKILDHAHTLAIPQQLKHTQQQMLKQQREERKAARLTAIERRQAEREQRKAERKAEVARKNAEVMALRKQKQLEDNERAAFGPVIVQSIAHAREMMEKSGGGKSLSDGWVRKIATEHNVEEATVRWHESRTRPRVTLVRRDCLQHIDDGWTVDRIARHYGVTRKEVLRVL